MGHRGILCALAALGGLIVLPVYSFAGEAGAAAVDSVSFSAQDWQHIRSQCVPERDSDLFLHWEDFGSDYSRETLLAHSETIYASERRLRYRAFFDEASGDFRIPWAKEPGRSLFLPENFIKSVTRHIEMALERQYVDAVNFADMGHNHFNIPEERFLEHYAKIEDFGLVYEQYLADPTMLMAYHTAERLKMAERDERRRVIVSNDRYYGWRYYTRNLVGENSPEPKLDIYLEKEFIFNTIKAIEGYHWAAGVLISANKNGCFPYSYKGKTFYFDISLSDLTPDLSRREINKKDNYGGLVRESR